MRHGHEYDPSELPRYISAHEVAERAGVSRSAVSRTFTHGASVSPATREKVLRAAEELGYQVNDLARGLLANRSQLIGMIASDPETPFRALQISTLSRLLIENGRVPVLITTDRSETGGRRMRRSCAIARRRPSCCPACRPRPSSTLPSATVSR